MRSIRFCFLVLHQLLYSFGKKKSFLCYNSSTLHKFKPIVHIYLYGKSYLNKGFSVVLCKKKVNFVAENWETQIALIPWPMGCLTMRNRLVSSGGDIFKRLGTNKSCHNNCNFSRIEPGHAYVFAVST